MTQQPTISEFKDSSPTALCFAAPILLPDPTIIPFPAPHRFALSRLLKKNPSSAEHPARHPAVSAAHHLEQRLRAAALRRVKSRVDPPQYQIFDLCVLRGAEPKIVAAKLGVKLWKVYLVRKRMAQRVARELKEVERE